MAAFYSLSTQISFYGFTIDLPYQNNIEVYYFSQLWLFFLRLKKWKFKYEERSFFTSTGWLRVVIGTIPSIPIPIPFANFGIELTPNSNSSLGIGATTPTPIQRNWGDSKGFQCLF